ncbi:MAG: HTTM domain-containing protein [Spartobacteria bacterium]
MTSLKNIFCRLEERAFTRVDIASLVFFRITFGLLMLWHVSTFFFNQRIARYWLEPRILFKYPGFEWVQPWPGNGLYIHFAVLTVLALFIVLGFLYRPSAALFCIGYTYTFFLDEALWVNHKYLICLLSFLLAAVPAHRAFSIDAWLRSKLRADTTPAWSLWLLRTQMGVVYFFAGVAKLMPDWLFHAEPMRLWLARGADFPVIGRFFREEWAVYTFSYTALLFDLGIVPLLLWRRTRLPAFIAAIGFHLLNYRLFHIGVFPWLAIVTTTLFLSPSWPRQLLSILQSKPRAVKSEHSAAPESAWQHAIFVFVLVYIAIQLLVPLRPFLYRGGAEWQQAEHRFTWRMMLIGKWQRAYFM